MTILALIRELNHQLKTNGDISVATRRHDYNTGMDYERLLSSTEIETDYNGKPILVLL